MEHKNSIGWLSAASFGVAGTINFFNLGPVLQAVGNIGIILFIIGMLIALVGGYGWLKVVLANPNYVGGATVNSFESFKSRSPLLLTILCFGNWASWVAQLAISSTFCAAAMIQWLSLSYFSTTSLSIILLVTFILIGLTKLTFAARIIVPAALIMAVLLILSAILPLYFGKVHLVAKDIFTIKLQFSGWFAYLTAIMSGFYLIGWIVPAYEVTTWLSGEMKQPENNLPRAFILTAIISSLSFILLPFIWLGSVGYNSLIADYTVGTNWLFINQLFPGFGKTFATICGFLFVMSYLLCSGIGSIIGPSRMLVQLAEYGLLPRLYQKRLANGAPWVAVCTAGILAILIVLLGAPLWLISATNFGYLASMILASLGAWFLARENLTTTVAISDKLVTTGLALSTIWVFSILLGYQQYGMVPMMGGVAFVLLGAIPYLFRKILDIHQRGERINLYSIHITLPFIFFILVGLNSSGYLLMLLEHSQVMDGKTAILQDIFITVILLTLTLGLWITDSVGNIAVKISNASQQLAKITMPELVNGMKALGAGLLDKDYMYYSMKVALNIQRKDELGIMIKNFLDLEAQIKNVFNSMIAAKDQLRNSRKKMLDAQQQLIDTAHQAGMAQVATNVLHNVGNVLNSVNVSASEIIEKLEHSKLPRLTDIAHLITEHNSDLINFLTTDSKGILILKYIVQLAEHLQTEQQSIIKEANALLQYIEHIKNIIAMQQSLGGITGLEQEVEMAQLLDDVIAIAVNDFKSLGIIININCQLDKPILSNKIKLMQILINLVKNARDALLGSVKKEKILTINARVKSPNTFVIEVIDNGIGILSENMRNIFQHGFTTKKQGHGFGLHSCALAASEMGGELLVYSAGEHQGTTFSLELPYILANIRDQVTF